MWICVIRLMTRFSYSYFSIVCLRQVRERDLVMPEKARAVARELGLPYYETSVLTYYGVDELFENAIRAALCARRNQRFWMAGLKKVLQPALQVCLAYTLISSKTGQPIMFGL